jgi:hypothetical protein
MRAETSLADPPELLKTTGALLELEYLSSGDVNTLIPALTTTLR